MKARVTTLSLNDPLNSALLLLPGVAMAASAVGNIGPAYGFIYGVTLAWIGQQLAIRERISIKNLAHFWGLTLVIPGIALAATTGGEFQAFYDFIYNAATGYLGRGLAITGGVFGLAYGIGKGSPLPAVLGIVLAIFGMLGPTIVNALFNSATI
jgi:hypothetical protein